MNAFGKRGGLGGSGGGRPQFGVAKPMKSSLGGAASAAGATRPGAASSRSAIVPCMMPARRWTALAVAAGTCVTVVLTSVLLWPAVGRGQLLYRDFVRSIFQPA